MTSNTSSEIKLNQEQKQAVEYGSGPLLIIAGAGTGKTTVITERIKHLIAKELAKPAEILALTFTEKAAREMEERVDKALPYGYTQMWISTFHAFCDRILRNEAIHMGLSPAYRLLTEAGSTMFLKSHLFELNLNYFRPLGNPNKFVGAMLKHFSRLKDEDVTPKQYTAWVESQISNHNDQKSEEERLESAKYKELAGAYIKYEELKIKENVVDFADLISGTLELFRRRPNILKNYRNQFKYILVDEFQDTNIAQNELIKLLAGEQKNITAVADDDQSIYKFRGAAVSNVIQFRKNFPKRQLIVLTQNYRSTAEILDKSYKLIQHNNPDRLEVKEKINKKLKSVRNIKGEPVKFIRTDRVENEAEQVVKEIRKLAVGSGQSAEEKKYSWKDFAILVRANNHAEPFVRAFQRLGVPYQFLGPGQLFRQPEVKDLIAYLEVLDNFENNQAFYKVVSNDFFEISARDLVALANFSRRQNLSLFEAAEILVGKRVWDGSLPFVADETKKKLEPIVKMLDRHFKLLKKETAGQMLYYFLQDTGMLKNILEYKFPLDEKKAQNITRFFNKLKTFEAEHEDASVTAVLDYILMSMELGESPLATDVDWTDNDAVNILTVHSSKGLEFKVVFLVNLVSQRFPTSEKREPIPLPDALIKEVLPEGDYHEEEERRLFYVGMTRARDRLYLTSANYYGEGKREKKISPFVNEALGKSVLTKPQMEEENQLLLLDWQKIEIAPTKAVKYKVNYLSYSRIEEFKLCPLHYKLRYILNIQPAPTAALSFGVSVHETLRQFYAGFLAGQKLTDADLFALYKKSWLHEGYTSKNYENLMFTRGQKYLEGYFKKEFPPQHKPLVLEQPFTISLKKDNEFLKIGGKIDRIDELSDGKIEIVDYKTGRVPTKKEIEKNLQLAIYGLGATQLKELPFGKSSDQVVLSLYYFETQEKFSTTRTGKELGTAVEEIFAVKREIENSDFSCSGSDMCRTCEYKLFCLS